jgi:GTP cyclohydrolase II
MNNILLSLLTIILSFNVYNDCQSILLPTTYPLVLEKLIFFKKNQFKAFYGGPISKHGNGAQWLMPIIFEDDQHNTRAVYEITLINCNLETAKDAHLYFIDTSDIDIKFKNELTQNYTLFSSLINGEYTHDKYIVIRSCDVAAVFFPDIFIASVNGENKQSDKNDIVQFLYKEFQTQQNYTVLETQKTEEHIRYENENEIVYFPIPVQVKIENQAHLFFIEKKIKKNDLWKIYYIISTNIHQISETKNDNVLLRIDSGCASGQIYDDNTCDCLDQLHDALKQIAFDKNNLGIIIHIPGHDGRGFGSAPKAETEIYKYGGQGRVHNTTPLNTTDAANLLYGTDIYDLRTFDGIAHLLQDMNISKVILLTDNVIKVTSLQNNGIEVIRQKTDTNKLTCIDHIEAKKNSTLYFSE